jgi:hypothetical protein
VKDQITVAPSVYRGLAHLLRTELPIEDLQGAYKWCKKQGHESTANWILLNPEQFAAGLVEGFTSQRPNASRIGCYNKCGGRSES